MFIARGVKLLDEITGDGAPVEQGAYHLLSIRLRLSKGDIVREPDRCFGCTWDRDVLAELGHSEEGTRVLEDGYYKFCVRIHRENLKGGYLYALKGMKVGGYRKVIIGPNLAHGEEGIPGVIPPNAKITAEIKVLR